jgi:hypothetical protein
MKEKWYIPKGYAFMEGQKVKITKLLVCIINGCTHTWTTISII